VYCVILFLFS